ncbi:MAG: nuclear transport factor 2 family protein [Haloarculaceae archaeon]
MEVEELPERARAWVEAFNSHDADATMRQLADGGTFDDPVTDEPVQGEKLRGYIHETYEAFPDVQIVPKSYYEDGDAVVLEVDYTGTFEGSFEGIPPTGEYAELPAVIVLNFADDGVVSCREYWNKETFREELGLTFPEIVRHVPRLVGGKLRAMA